MALDHVSKRFRVRGRERQRRRNLLAVDDVSFTIEPGAAVALVGASGSGKSTIAGIVTGAFRPTSGSVTYGELEVHRLRSGGQRHYHHDVQMVFQDPYGALNPLHTVGYIVSRPCRNYLGMSAHEADRRVHELLEL